MIELRKNGYRTSIRELFGTEIASAPALDRVRSKNVFPFRSNSTDSTITGSLSESSFKTGRSITALSSSALNRVAAWPPLSRLSLAHPMIRPDKAPAAADFNTVRLEICIREC
jgi:hypothetical protein